jgi:hypothetical protein
MTMNEDVQRIIDDAIIAAGERALARDPRWGLTNNPRLADMFSDAIGRQSVALTNGTYGAPVPAELGNVLVLRDRWRRRAAA